MNRGPTFASQEEHRARVGDLDFWWPHLRAILDRHDLTDARHEPVAGYNVTYPTFVYGEVVVKLFGYSSFWRAGYAAEQAAYALLAADPEIAAPRVHATGRVSDGGEDDGDADAADTWAYLITSRMPGVASWRVELSDAQWIDLATSLGQQVQRLHGLPPTGVATYAAWSPPPIGVAAARSSLPPHLAAQAEAYVARLGPFVPTVVHGDITANHVYVQDGRFVGIIDWGDLLVADRHLELIQPYRDLFRCDKTLLRVFLAAAGWPVGPDFPLLALGHALHRQAVGLAQHTSIDVFMPIAERYPLQEIATLDELATLLFADA